MCLGILCFYMSLYELTLSSDDSSRQAAPWSSPSKWELFRFDEDSENYLSKTGVKKSPTLIPSQDVLTDWISHFLSCCWPQSMTLLSCLVFLVSSPLSPSSVSGGSLHMLSMLNKTLPCSAGHHQHPQRASWLPSWNFFRVLSACGILPRGALVPWPGCSGLSCWPHCVVYRIHPNTNDIIVTLG